MGCSKGVRKKLKRNEQRVKLLHSSRFWRSSSAQLTTAFKRGKSSRNGVQRKIAHHFQMRGTLTKWCLAHNCAYLQKPKCLNKWCSAHNCAPLSNVGNPHQMVPSAQLRVPSKARIPHQTVFVLTSAMFLIRNPNQKVLCPIQQRLKSVAVK